ncbi:TonB family protein [Hydrogenivirga sp.]
MRLRVALAVSILLHALFVSALINFSPPKSEPINHTISVSLKNLRIDKAKKKIPRELKERRVKKRKARPVKRKSRKLVRKQPEKPAPVREEKVQKPKEEPKPREETKSPKEPSREEKEKVPPADEERVAYTPPSDYPVGIGDEEEEEEETASYGEEFVEENLSVIREIVERYLTYPPVARRMGWEGTVVVRFVLTPSGVVEEENIEKSSGHEILDRNALRVVRIASREFPRPSQSVVVVLPVVYRLE